MPIYKMVFLKATKVAVALYLKLEGIKIKQHLRLLRDPSTPFLDQE